MAKSNYFKKYNHSDIPVHVYNDINNEYLIDVNGKVTFLNGVPVDVYRYSNGELYVRIKRSPYSPSYNGWIVEKISLLGQDVSE